MPMVYVDPLGALIPHIVGQNIHAKFILQWKVIKHDIYLSSLTLTLIYGNGFVNKMVLFLDSFQNS